MAIQLVINETATETFGDIVDIIDFAVTEAEISAFSSSSFTLFGMVNGINYTANGQGTGFTTTDIGGETYITGGTLSSLTINKAGATLATATNANLSMSGLSSAIMNESTGSLYAIENFFMSMAWDISLGNNSDFMPSGATIGDGAAFNLRLADTIRGNGGNDTLFSGDGNDTLIGGLGADDLDGGAGADVANYAASGAGVRINLLAGQGAGGDAQGDSLANIESLTGSNHNDILYGTSTNNALRGGAGNDIIRPYQGGDFIDGGAGTDILDYNYTNVALNINLATHSVTRMDGYTGPGGYSQSVYNMEFVRGSHGGDQIRADLAQDTTMYGFNGNDVLIGFGGDDRLIGGAGNDRMSGGAANDLLYGQAGSDWFYATDAMARDQVMDWQDGSDRLHFGSVAAVDSFADITVTHGSLGAYVWWDEPGNGFWIMGQSTSVVDAGDFIF